MMPCEAADYFIKVNFHVVVDIRVRVCYPLATCPLDNHHREFGCPKPKSACPKRFVQTAFSKYDVTFSVFSLKIVNYLPGYKCH